MKFYLLVATVFFSLHISAQKTEFVFKNFTQEEGLPSNEAYFVFEDSKHFLWFATDLGVVRYNGSRFEQFNLPDNVVFKIKEDSKGRIWFFSHKAQFAFFENEKIHPYKYNNIIAKRISKLNIVEGEVDAQENLVLNSSTDSSYTINKNGIIKTTGNNLPVIAPTEFSVVVKNKNLAFYKISGSEKMGNNFIFNIDINGQKRVINIPLKHDPFSHYGGIIINDTSLLFFAKNLLFEISNKGIYKIKRFPNDILCLEQYKGNIWVGMFKSGAVALNENLTDSPDNDTLLTDHSVTSIKHDYEGGLWFSTLENGIYYVKNTNLKKLLKKEKVTRLLNFKDSFLIYGNNNGLQKLTANGAVPIINENNYSVSDIRYDNSNNLYWYASFANRYSLLKKSPDKTFNFLYMLLSPSEIAIRNDSFFASLSNKTILFKAPAENTNSSYIRSFITAKPVINKSMKLFKDNKGIIWGGYQDGLYKERMRYDTILQVAVNDMLLQKGITCLRQMDNGLMVAGIRFGGVALLQDTTVIANITEQDGLLSDKVRHLLPVKNQLWVVTAKGLSVIKFGSFNPLKFSINNIGKNDGFYNVTINHLIQFKKDIIAATSNGIYFIKNADELTRRNPAIIPFYINSISYYRGDTSGTENITLPYTNNRIVVKYSAACFNSNEELKYQYSFSSSDTGWITANTTELLLENLEPGDYHLKLKAIIPSQERSSEIQQLHIVVEKPWWQNNWLRFAVIFLFAAAGFFFARYRIKKIKTEEQRKTSLNAKIAELEQTALRSQMNPHFIFNCLTSIQQLILSGNKTDANEYLVKFSRLIRKTLDLSANSFISIKDELNYLDEYLCLEQLRTPDNFVYHLDADKNIDTDKILIPNMMIQPVVENCVRHGIKSLENKKGIIEVQISFKNDHLICIITDNGVGRKGSITNNGNDLTNHKSYGIDIVEKRLKAFTELNEQAIGVEIKDLYDTDNAAAGTEVILHLPFKKII